MSSFPVELYIYDISKGLAKSLSPLFLGGKQIDGIWHTGIVIYNTEFFFGSDGISSCPPCGTILGKPDNIVKMGVTKLTKEAFLEYLNQLSQNKFRGECYHLFDHNCNTFSDVVSQFLTGTNIPSYITSLPAEVTNTPLGSLLKPYFDQMSPQIAYNNCGQGKNEESTKDTVIQIKNSDIFTTHYESAELLAVFGSCKISKHDSKVVEEMLEYLLINDDINNSWSMAPTHINLLCQLLLSEEVGYKNLSSLYLQMLFLRLDVLNLVFKYNKSNFCNLLTEYLSYSNEVLKELLLVLCNVLSCEKHLNCISDFHIQLITNICQHCILSSNIQLNIHSCRLFNNILQIGKDRFDIFTLGVSLIELYNQSSDVLNEEISLWMSLKTAIEINPQLADVCKAMQIHVAVSSSDAKINKLMQDINAYL